jgi:hypothetical protein
MKVNWSMQKLPRHHLFICFSAIEQKSLQSCIEPGDFEVDKWMMNYIELGIKLQWGEVEISSRGSFRFLISF